MATSLSRLRTASSASGSAVAVVHVGTAGWSYSDWEGVLYPKPHPRGFDPLAYLVALRRRRRGQLDVLSVPSTRTSRAVGWIA